jgi:hypothetical protein
MAETKIYTSFYYAENTERKCILQEQCIKKRRVPLDFFELKVAGGGGDTAGK